MSDETENDKFALIAGVVISAVFTAIVVCAYVGGCQTGYRDGQIDSANGTQKWRLTTMPSGERLWKEHK